MRAIKSIAKNFINLLYPLHCLGCGKPLKAMDELSVCVACGRSINKNAMPPFELEPRGVKAYSACLYEGTLKELIHKFKYKGKTTLCALFSKLMIDYTKENPELATVDLITVVPLHIKRLKKREFNQSLLLAGDISKHFAKPLKNILEKTRPTAPQNELSKSERLVNLKNAFKARDGIDIMGKNILIIDDVMTTGATLNECAGTLLDSGAKNVTCFALARGI